MTATNPFGWIGIAASLVGFALAAAVYGLRPDRAQNRYVALMIAAAAIGWGAERGLRHFADDYATAVAWRMTGQVFWAVALAGYMLTLSTLPTPLVAWLKRPWGVAVGVGACLAWAAAALVVPEGFVSGEVMYQALPGLWQRELEDGPLLFGWELFALVLWVYAIAASFSAWRRAASPSSRAQLGAYMLAFVVHDVILFAWVALVTFGTFRATPLLVFAQVGPPLASLWLYSLLAYGILRAQLFDIDVRVKLGIRRSVVAGTFLLAFFVASELAQNWLSDRMGWLTGGLVAGALLFAFAPIQRAAEGVARAAMPDVRATDEYLAYRKVEVYKGAVEEMFADGALTDRDRAVLAGIRRRLGLGEASATAIERDVHASRVAVAAA